MKETKIHIFLSEISLTDFQYFRRTFAKIIKTDKNERKT